MNCNIVYPMEVQKAKNQTLCINIIYDQQSIVIISMALFPFALLLALILAVNAFNMHSSCSVPIMYEHLEDYKIPVQDLRDLILNNLTSINIPNTSNKDTQFFSFKTSVNYLGVGRNIQKISDFEYSVANDSFSLNLEWTANVSKTFGHNTYKVKAKASAVQVAYTKGYDFKTSMFYVKDTTYNFKASSIEIVDPITPTPSASDKQKIDILTQTGLFLEIDKQFKSLGPWMNDNVQKTTLAQVYTTDSYVYDFYGWKVNFNTKILSVSQSETDLNIGFYGDIIGQTDTQCPKQFLNASEPGFSGFFSFQFIHNLATYTIQNYAPYQNVLINSTWIRSRYFQFRLVDLEFMLKDALVKYPSLYMNEIRFTCAAQSLASSYIEDENEKLHLLVSWKCFGFVVGKNESELVQILDFEPTIDHQHIVMVSGDRLNIYSDFLSLIDIKFNEVDGMKVNDEELAKVYMEEFYNDMRRYVPGTYFKVKKGSSKTKWVVDHEGVSGIWIG